MYNDLALDECRETRKSMIATGVIYFADLGGTTACNQTRKVDLSLSRLAMLHDT